MLPIRSPQSEIRNPLRVAWLFEYPTLHGGERSLLTALPMLREAGVEPVALAPTEGPLAAVLAQQGVPIVAFASRAHDGTRRSQETLRREFASALEQRGLDLLHANSLAMGRLSGPVTSELRLPSLAHLRDIVGLSSAAVADLNRHRRLLAVSQATRDFHVAQGIEAARVHVVYNGVDLEAFRPRPPSGWLHKQLDLPRDALLLGTIGQIVIRKAHDVLARAAAQLAARLPTLHWIIVGSRHSQKAEAVEHEAAVRASFAAAGLAGRVHFLGTLDDVAELLPELCLLVHPARQEPLGRVLLEAAAAGLACVATDVGGTREVFPPASAAARLVSPGDAGALAAAIAELASDDELRHRLGRAARRRAEEAFDIRARGRELVEHYRAACT